MSQAFVAGFALGYGLILAIGAQNAFVLRQGLRREHVFAVCLTCAVSDAILIVAGIAGFGALATAVPWFEQAMRLGGAGFLIVYGCRSLWSAWKGGSVLHAGNGQRTGLVPTLMTVLAFTWLNPHVYLDTVVLIGSIAAQYADRLNFALGAISASFFFFFTLGYGARMLAPVFARPRAWQFLDVLIGLVMFSIALKLIVM